MDDETHLKTFFSPVANYTSWDLNHKHSVDTALVQKQAKYKEQS